MLLPCALKDRRAREKAIEAAKKAVKMPQCEGRKPSQEEIELASQLETRARKAWTNYSLNRAWPPRPQLTNYPVLFRFSTLVSDRFPKSGGLAKQHKNSQKHGKPMTLKPPNAVECMNRVRALTR